MARKPRKYGNTGCYHVIMRGNNRETIFYDDNDRLFFISRLQKYKSELNIEIYSYCLMGNHIHLLIGKANETMSLLVKKLACSYVYYFNHKYDRTGHLFQGRYKSEPIENIEYFKTVLRYILQNPEKANICHFHQYRWSSISSNRYNKSIINSDFIKAIFESRSQMNAFINLRNSDICMEDYNCKYSDDDIKIELIKQLFKYKSPLQLKHDPHNSKIEKIHFLKTLGFPINQIVRLTGITKHIVENA